MPPWFQDMLKVVPRLRTPIQLVGFLFTALSSVLIYRVDPSNIGSLTVVGSIGVAVITIPFAFQPNFINKIAMAQRAWFLLGLIAMLLCSFSALGYITYKAVFGLTPQGARFDSRLEMDKIRLIKHADSGYRAELTWRLFPLSSKDNEGATVFLGIVVLHDEEKIAQPGMGKKTDSSCGGVPSCIGSYIFRDLFSSPLLVRSNSPGSDLTTTVDVRTAPKNIRVWWEFYQREGLNGAGCGIDNTQTGPAEGLPALAMFDKQGIKVGNLCYRSFGQKTVSTVF